MGTSFGAFRNSPPLGKLAFMEEEDKRTQAGKALDSPAQDALERELREMARFLVDLHLYRGREKRKQRGRDFEDLT
jgi:hypothetical protein